MVEPLKSPNTLCNQGDIYWIVLDDAVGSVASIRHPYVVLQEDVFNHSRLNTVVICAITSNLHRATIPGNILLAAGEGNLVKPSVVEVSKVSSIDKTHLGDYVGALTEQRIQQILAGMLFLQRAFYPR